MTLTYGSVCSGIEAATVAWHGLGWRAAWFSEIEPFPCAVLAHHYPDVPNLGDMTTIRHSEVFQHATLDVLVGGTPCQSFSVAGLRKGLADPRGNLALEFLALADAARPRWLVWENVPGVLSSNGGRDFGAYLGGLGQLGYGWAYRVLDAQYFGSACRRRRLFVVGCLGDWRGAAAALFERASLQGRSEQSEREGHVIALNGRQDPVSAVELCGTIDASGQPTWVVVADGYARWLSPLEYERLLGFPDDYTLIPYRGKPAADGPRYKALGNSMAVPCMSWLGRRIEEVAALCSSAKAAS